MSSDGIRQIEKQALPLAPGGAKGSSRLHELRSRIFGNTRLLRVWLPPDYDVSGATRYPVFYLNDGQNLFEAVTAFAGVPWAVGETAARLIDEGKIAPLIIVGIDNMGKDRIREYIPYRSFDPRVLRPKGKRYPQFLRQEVMPLIEEQYPVAKGPAHTGLGGSSLGGLITLYTQLAMPGVFGRLLIESPSLFVANRKILDACSRFHEWPDRMFVGIGTRETGVQVKDERAVNDVKRFERILSADGLGESRLRVCIDEGAAHSESAWAARFPQALEFLFGR